jgi:hypothetical protein
VHYNLDVLRAQEGRLEEAEAAWREAIRLNLEFAPGHHALRVLLEQHGDPEETE